MLSYHFYNCTLEPVAVIGGGVFSLNSFAGVFSIIFANLLFPHHLPSMLPLFKFLQDSPLENGRLFQLPQICIPWDLRLSFLCLFFSFLSQMMQHSQQ